MAAGLRSGRTVSLPSRLCPVSPGFWTALPCRTGPQSTASPKVPPGKNSRTGPCRPGRTGGSLQEDGQPHHNTRCRETTGMTGSSGRRCTGARSGRFPDPPAVQAGSCAPTGTGGRTAECRKPRERFSAVRPGSPGPESRPPWIPGPMRSWPWAEPPSPSLQ